MIIHKSELRLSNLSTLAATILLSFEILQLSCFFSKIRRKVVTPFECLKFVKSFAATCSSLFGPMVCLCTHSNHEKTNRRSDDFMGREMKHQFNIGLTISAQCCNYEKTTTMDIIFREFLILYQIFFSRQVKRSVIISNKQGIYELPYELSNEDIGKLGKIGKISKLMEL